MKLPPRADLQIPYILAHFCNIRKPAQGGNPSSYSKNTFLRMFEWDEDSAKVGSHMCTIEEIQWPGGEVGRPYWCAVSKCRDRYSLNNVSKIYSEIFEQSKGELKHSPASVFLFGVRGPSEVSSVRALRQHICRHICPFCGSDRTL